MVSTIVSHKPRKAQRTARPATNWSVVMKADAFGYGFVAQRSADNMAAFYEGWVLVAADMTMREACQMRDDLRAGLLTLEMVAV